MIINPTNTEHTISFVPRFYPIGGFSYKMVDSVSNYEEEDEVLDYATNTEGKIEFTMEADVISETRYKLTIKEGDEIVYRGIVIATSQNTQDYQLTNDKYYF